MPATPKTVLVTGATSGIGEATVRLFAEQGWNVVATTRRDDRSQFADLANVRLIHMEQSDPASVETAVAEAAQAFGGLDVLVNNAGYCLMSQLEDTPMSKIRKQYETNVFGLIAVTQAVLPHLKATGGGIVNVASISADNGYPFNSVYSSSKAAVMGLTEGLNVELSCVGVSAKAVLPGFIATDIFTKLDAPDTMPEAYRPLWSQFTTMQRAVKGFDPVLVARSIFEAATDGKADKVRYHPTPDAAGVPKAKRMMGEARYWRVFRRALLDGPNWLQRKMSPQGTRDVKVVLPEQA